jgi:hypothetical protein
MDKIIAWLVSALVATGVPTIAEMQQAFTLAQTASGVTLAAEFRVNESLPLFLGAVLRDGTCQIRFNPRHQVTAQVLLGELHGEAREAMLVAGLIHELAHCQEALLVGRSYDAALLTHPSLLEYARDQDDWRALQDGSAQAHHWSEVLADLAMVAYLNAQHPAVADTVLRHLIRVRALGGRLGDIGHDTSEYLANAAAELQRRPPETVPFEAALRLRRELGERESP